MGSILNQPFNIITLNAAILSVLLCTLGLLISNMRKRKKANRALEELKDRLENMVDERTRELTVSNQQLQEEIVKRERAQEALRRAKEAAESANRAKSYFLANMSHELRTPLNAILGFSKLMEQNPDATDLQRENLGIINRSGEHLLELINDVLEMSKIEAGQIKLNLTQFNFHNSIKGIEEMIRGRAEEKGLVFNVEYKNSPQYIKTDESKFRQVLINLLSNAIKFTESGKIFLRVFEENKDETSEKNLKKLLVEIEDTGIGIPEKERHAIFDSFSKISHDKYGMEGSGLGLSISKKLIELMDGEIYFESKEKYGSMFRFYIQYQQINQNSPPHVIQAKKIISIDKNWKHIKILVAEDKWENRLLLKRVLRRVGLNVIEANNGKESVEQFQMHNPELIFMDIRMPAMSGIDATRKIRKISGGKKVKIIAITAHAFEEFREEILAVGFDDFIRKPYKELDIFENIQKHLGVTFVTNTSVNDQENKSSSDIKLVELKPEKMTLLPENIREKLRKAALDLDVSNFENIIDDIDSSYPDIATSLLELSRQFRYDHVLECLNI